ncbi:enhanced level of genomic instability 1 [Epargyreus clarus]|uniref:enhanced level of genomic instability 1 n=1 Tax=Epargyreus clarus TaxID=520877 RepID=UPI003C2E47AA
MSTLLMDGRSFTSKTVSNYHRNEVLKSKENIFKPKCNKALKKKLKKYKLRRDGQEDPDIIDVSQTLITSLRIKSPNQPLNFINGETLENRPHNYLTKMVRLKKTVTVESSPTDNGKSDNDVRDENISVTPKGDQDKKQTDAFKLLMDSRNKSLGSNSPGKDKCEDESEAQEKIEKREIKAKRILSLNKMALAKGSLKKKEIEEYREEAIKRKMDDRAERLKDMIVNVETKHKKKEKIKPTIKKVAEKIVSPPKQEVVNNLESLNNKSPILKTFDIFKDIKTSPIKNIKKISKEDEEFLKKLSPSIRKKENMLCYFQKVSKDSEILPDDCDDESQIAEELIIKVKLKTKTKVKKKKTKDISEKEITLPVHDDVNLNNNAQPDNSALNNNSHKRKRHLNNNKDKEIQDSTIQDSAGPCNEDSRPKRNTKRPVKYAEDFQLTSSDEELHIFTPKKKRKEKVEGNNHLKPVNDNNFEDVKNGFIKSSEKDVKLKSTKTKELKKKPKNSNGDKIEGPKNKSKESSIPKKATKLAPIFVAKPQLDPAALEAKQKFLHSGVPSQLKKQSIQQSNTMATDEFQTVVHVQSLSNTNTVNMNNSINYIDISYDEDIHLRQEEGQFRKLLDLTALEDRRTPVFQNNVDLTLEEIKKSYPRFPVYRTYHLLKGKSKGEFKDCIYPDLDNSVEIYNNMVDINNINPDKLNWTDKYKPTTQKQVIGNFESIRELKRWLITWTENDAKSKKNKDKGSDSSDFYNSDTDSRETMRNMNNLLVITGKVGTGKTLSVYAVAAELAIKVIEVNASTKRTGKIMLQDLQEATQSHKVDRGKSNTESSQKSQETKCSDNKIKVMKKRGRKKKVPQDNPEIKTVKDKESVDVTVRQENIRTGMSLILIDDADIVFDQDDGFCSAISQLIQTSKRPVILVTSSLTCPHLQKFIHLAKVIKMRPFLPRMLGTWLDIMCLADNNMCSPGLGAKTLDLFKGDIRKTINCLQFYMTSQKHLCNASDAGNSQGDAVTKLNADDENSCMSWMDNEGWGDKNIVASNSDDSTSKFGGRKQLQLNSFSSSTNLDVWWNLPNLLNYTELNKPTIENTNRNKLKDINDLNTISSMLETISMTDYMENFNINNGVNITSGPWHSCESASVIDNENFTNYNRNNDCINNITCELVIKGVSEAQRVLECDNKTEVHNPSMAIQRERDRVASQYKTLTSHLNPSAVLDRRALALDYWPSCRNICRTEKSKTDNNSKRNNRFCHYLKSLNVLCRNEYFDNLGEGLTYCNKE